MSDKPVAAKLLIRPGSTVWISDPARAALVAPLPDGARVVPNPDGAATAVAFVDDAAAVRALLDRHAAALRSAAAFWVVYRKANRADINRDSLWPLLGEHGFRPITQVAIDEEWSALRFRPLKPGEQSGDAAG
ncbi:MAG: hypothetical protein ACJ77B_10375 [Chloroflexota bacterium]